jgi:hypothetical protein
MSMTYILFVLFLNGSLYTKEFYSIEYKTSHPKSAYSRCISLAASVEFKFSQKNKNNIWRIECVPLRKPQIAK